MKKTYKILWIVNITLLVIFIVLVIFEIRNLKSIRIREGYIEEGKVLKKEGIKKEERRFIEPELTKEEIKDRRRFSPPPEDLEHVFGGSYDEKDVGEVSFENVETERLEVVIKEMDKEIANLEKELLQAQNQERIRRKIEVFQQIKSLYEKELKQR